MERDKLESKVIDSKITNEVEGKVEAVFSVFNEMDSDGDVVMPNAIKSGYGDSGVAMVWAHDWKNPIGRGVIKQDGDKATFKGQFIMDTQAGKDAFNTVKAMGDLQQWSFGYEVLDYENGTYQKDSETPVDARYLKELNVWEVSPVLVGANQNTFTVGVKENNDEDVEEKSEATEKELSGLTLDEQSDDLLIKLSELLSRFKELTALRLGKEKVLSEKSASLVMEVQDALQEAFQDLDTLLSVATPEKLKEEEIDDTTLLLETERVLMETLDPNLIVGE